MATTRFTLLELSKIIAPAMPFLSEDIYLKLGGVKESVHLENWPKPRRLNREEKVLIKDMETCRKIVSIALEKRAEAKIKVRQPLGALRVKNMPLHKKNREAIIRLIKDETNIKQVTIDNMTENEVELDTNITDELKKEGQFREIIRFIQDIRKKQNFIPSQKAILSVWAGNESRTLIERFENEIKKSATLEKIKFLGEISSGKDMGEELSVDGMTFRFELEKSD